MTTKLKFEEVIGLRCVCTRQSIIRPVLIFPHFILFSVHISLSCCCCLRFAFQIQLAKKSLPLRIKFPVAFLPAVLICYSAAVATFVGALLWKIASFLWNILSSVCCSEKLTELKNKLVAAAAAELVVVCPITSLKLVASRMKISPKWNSQQKRLIIDSRLSTSLWKSIGKAVPLRPSWWWSTEFIIYDHFFINVNLHTTHKLYLAATRAIRHFECSDVCAFALKITTMLQFLLVECRWRWRWCGGGSDSVPARSR